MPEKNKKFVGLRKMLVWAIVMALAFVALGLSWIDASVWKEVVIFASGFFFAANSAVKFSRNGQAKG